MLNLELGVLNGVLAQFFWITVAACAVGCTWYAVSTLASMLFDVAQAQRDEQQLRLRLQGKIASEAMLANSETGSREGVTLSLWKRPLWGSKTSGPCRTLCEHSVAGRRFLRLLEQAGFVEHIEAVLQWWLAVLLSFMILGVALGSPLLSIAMAVLMVIGSLVYVQACADGRRQALRAAIPDMLDELAQSLRAGRSFSQALRFVLDGQSEDSPTIDVLRRLDADASLGRNYSKSLHDMAGATELRELKSVAAVIDITAQIGGSAPALLEELATSIRQDLMLDKKLKVQTAQGRSSVRLVGSIPFILIGLLSLMMPGYLGLWLSTAGGQMLFVLAIGLVVVGFLWVRSVVNIHV